MLLGSMKEIERYVNIYPQLKKIQSFLDELGAFETGQRIISDTIKGNFLTYETGMAEERVWEAHRKDIDIHYIISGNEQIQIAPRETLIADEYHEEDDYYLLHGVAQQTYNVRAGDFLICFQNEPHRTGVKIVESETIEKIVFKVRD
jgi:YhcH/YjgK/YiaL family protein